MGVGNISLERGGYMAPHSSHQRGVDVDIIPVRTDGREDGVTIHQAAYSRSRTQSLLNLVWAELSIRVILFNDGGVTRVQYWPGHDNHFHVSIN
jgi:murein endopeptidase